MFQKFYEDTLISRFIKSLLESEYIPSLRQIRPGMNLLKGNVYMKDGNVVLAGTKNDTSSILDSDADLTVLPNTTYTVSNFVSNIPYYDEKTHKHLGNYLRYVRDTTEINLMPYYNCYNGTELTNIVLDDTIHQPLYPSDELICDSTVICGSSSVVTRPRSFQLEENPRYRTVAVPVRYDTTYTVAIESCTGACMRGIVYNDSMLKIDNFKSLPSTFAESDYVNRRENLPEYYSDYLEDSFVRLSSCRFSEPQLVCIPMLTNDNIDTSMKKELLDLEDHLYLVIQIPKHALTSIVVLEGNYVHTDDYNPLKPQDHVLDNYSLLSFNTGESYAFSDRLVEYLLWNVVCSTEPLANNVLRVQSSISKISEDYNGSLLRKHASRGVWDSRIQEIVRKFIVDNRYLLTTSFDNDGNVNKDIEKLFSLKGVYAT